MIGGSSALTRTLMLLCLWSYLCFASLKMDDFGRQHNIGRRLQNTQWMLSEAIKTVSTISTNNSCTEYADGKCGSVCAMGMKLRLEESYFQSGKRTFQINLCGKNTNQNKCNSCFDGERCGKLCAYGGINCFDAWTRATRIVNGEKEYLLNPFRTSRYCKGGDIPQCPRFEKDTVDSDASFSEIEVSNANCDRTNGKKTSSWRCDETKPPQHIFKCLAQGH